MPQKNILVAPLNWGLGHATRCVPLIKALLARNYKVILASDGLAYDFLLKEFPLLPIYKLASLEIHYAKTKRLQGINMLQQLPKLFRFLAEDELAIQKIAKEIKIDGILSDNRPGIFIEGIPNIYINHQLQVKTGFTTFLSSKMHQIQMKKFTEIWVPDVEFEPCLSGELGHLNSNLFSNKIKYLGWISRLEAKDEPKKYDYCAIISGPEPQRSIFQEKVVQLFSNLKGNKILVTGSFKDVNQNRSFEVKSLLNTADLNRLINRSNTIICRSGYTSLLDLMKLQKNALLVPTPGQYEQEYLAKHMDQLGWFFVCEQAKFEKEAKEKLQNMHHVKKPTHQKIDWDFSVFK